MKNYELTCLISPDLSEEELKNISAKINSFIQEETGVLEKTSEPLKKVLGYPIKGKSRAFSVSLNFSLDPEKLKNLEKKLKSENQVLRYIILIKTALKEVLPRKKRLLKIPQKITEPSESAAYQSKAKKVELKEIDKKIEEILGE